MVDRVAQAEPEPNLIGRVPRDQRVQGIAACTVPTWSGTTNCRLATVDQPGVTLPHVPVSDAPTPAPIAPAYPPP